MGSTAVAIDCSNATGLSRMLKTLKGSYQNYVPPSGEGATSKLPLIQRLPFRLQNRVNFKKHYEPMVIAIGPIHYDKPGLSEDFKRGLAHLFIDNFIEDKTKIAYDAIELEISNLRKRYQEDVTAKYGDEELALMLFVDGCAVLAFIAKSVDNQFGKDFTIKSDFVILGARDLFLLENQLPYEVLDSLMNSSNNPADLREKIKRFIVRCMLHYDAPKLVRNYDLPSKPNHLLELLRSKFLGHGHSNDAEKNVRGSCNPVDCIINLISRDKLNEVPTFHNITELEAAAITVRKSETSYLTDISFIGERSLMATLNLPYMIIDDWTAPKFLNLVAYEMCPDFLNDFGISSYVCFMDSLIDKAEDVMELRDAGVLHNSLGSDEVVAILFNEIGTDLVPNYSTYSDVIEKIQMHYQNKRMMTWWAQFIHEHFSSPWTVLASLAALTGLVLTFIQTWESLKPSNNSPGTG